MRDEEEKKINDLEDVRAEKEKAAENPNCPTCNAISRFDPPYFMCDTCKKAIATTDI